LRATNKRGRQLFLKKKVQPPEKILATPMELSLSRALDGTQLIFSSWASLIWRWVFIAFHQAPYT